MPIRHTASLRDKHASKLAESQHLTLEVTIESKSLRKPDCRNEDANSGCIGYWSEVTVSWWGQARIHTIIGKDRGGVAVQHLPN